MVITLLVADLQANDNYIFVPLENSTNPQLNATIRKFENSSTRGDLQIENDNGTFYVSKSSHCADMDCQIATGTGVAPPYVPKNNANQNKSYFHLDDFFSFSNFFFIMNMFNLKKIKKIK